MRPAPPPQAEKGLPPSRAQGALTHRGRLPPEPPEGFALPPYGRPPPLPQIKEFRPVDAQFGNENLNPGRLNAYGPLCGPIWGAEPPSPPKTLLEAS